MGLRNKSIDNCRKGKKLNLVPTMSIFLLIIPMLLLSINFIELGSIDIALPAKTEVSKNDSVILDSTIPLLILEIKENSKFFIFRNESLKNNFISNKENENLFELENYLNIENQSRKESIIILIPDDEISYEILVSVIDICNKTGYTNINFSN